MEMQAYTLWDHTVTNLMRVFAEIGRARAKFPDNSHLLAALGEEYGELAKALLEYGNGPSARNEAMQVACVAVRIMMEGDADFAAAQPKLPMERTPRKQNKGGRPRKVKAAQQTATQAATKRAKGEPKACAACREPFHPRTSERLCPKCKASASAVQKAVGHTTSESEGGLA